MDLVALVARARQAGASDIHVEPGVAVTLRVRGQLRALDLRPDGEAVRHAVRDLLNDDEWAALQERRSADVARTLDRTRCRVHVLHGRRGLGLAIRLLSSLQPTLAGLNLHPDLARLVQAEHGLVLVTGATGSGKTSTAAALLHQVNVSQARHIITLEQPIEYALHPRLSFVRQREVGRDSPSFEQALLDALREDPDVLLVGEMRDPATMRLTLNAAETGHLVIATLHSSTAAEALQRLVGAFPAEIQPGICAQLADCLVGVVAQRLRFRADPGIRVPELEVLWGTQAARAVIRQGQFFKLHSVLESGGADGHWTFSRYADWLDRRTDLAPPSVEPVDDDEPARGPVAVRPTAPVSVARSAEAPPARAPVAASARTAERVLVLDEAAEDDPVSILAALEKRRK
ncbi:MAG: Flp pilus assembly complex ATPase component TadA [Deltaproteobacteria bacterium]|nr:Flp pilus assembly complex ATPase component TadA [Deltaproteobacteria bacterium]